MRYERDFETADKKPLGRDDLTRLIRQRESADRRTREDAIACYLAAADGWDEAKEQLGGAFAEQPPGLRESKRD